jgi:hypothetical protein
MFAHVSAHESADSAIVQGGRVGNIAVAHGVGFVSDGSLQQQRYSASGSLKAVAQIDADVEPR